MLVPSGRTGAVLGFGNQRHDVMQEGALLALTTLETPFRCSSLTPGIITELTFTRMPREVSISRPFAAVRSESAPLPPRATGGFASKSTVDLGADFRIDTVDGDGHMVDVVAGDFVHMLGQGQAVGGQAQLDVRRLVRQLPERSRRCAPGWPNTGGRRCPARSFAEWWPPRPALW